MYLNMVAVVFALIAIGAFVACWRMEHGSDENESNQYFDEKTTGER